jgi:hypothetical protein
MDNGFTIHISEHFIDCFVWFVIGVSYGIVLTRAVDMFRDRRKAK